MASAMPTPAQPAAPAMHAAPAAPAQPAAKPAPKQPAQPAMEQEVDDWVRNYEVEFVQHRPSATQRDLAGRHFHVLYEPNQYPYVELLARRFQERGAMMSCQTFDESGQVMGDPHPEGTPFYVIAILPKEAEMMSTSRERVQRMIHRLRRAVANTNPLSAKPLATGVAFVQFGNGRCGTEGMNNIESCTAAGFARALHLESPSLEVRIIDFHDTLSHFLSTDFITNEISAEGLFRDAAFDRFGRRFESRHRLLQPAEQKPMPLALNSGDVIIVTGGARGITAECAYAMAAKTGANFALVGSSPHPSQSGAAVAAGSGAAEIAATLQRFASLPGKCEYFSCNLTDETAVKQMIASVESTLGRVTGIVHGAGRNNAKAASAPSTEEVLSEISPKVLGATNLLEALADRELRCLVGLTSIIGVTGIPGNSWYAFSNETLDLLLRQYKAQHPDTLVRSISYSAWSEVGMGAKGNVEAALRRMGVGLIPPAEGIARFMHALEHDLEDPQMLVTGALGNIDTWRPTGRDKCSMALRYVENIVSHEPGVSVTSRVKLTNERDPYLLDHIYEGTCLFPAVLGMEAMSQVASYLMAERPTLVRIQNLELTRPIIVGQEGEVELEIHATAMETNADGETVISVGIRTERTQFQFDHFSTDIVFGKRQPGPRQQEMIGDRLGICPQKDLYSGILFQGPRFQRWGDTYALEEGKMTFDVIHSQASCRGEEVFGTDQPTAPLFTGDPFYRDVLLQSIQAVIPQKTGLPLSIEKIEFFAPSNPDAEEAGRRLVTSQLHVIAEEVGEEHICEVIARDPYGEVRERMSGYRVKVLAIKEEYPTAKQLADLCAFDQAKFTEQVNAGFAKFDRQPPVMSLRRLPQLHSMKREERHVVEKPLMEETVRKFQMEAGDTSVAPMIDWLPSGRPVVANDEATKISLSHDDDYCLCTASTTPAGCDIAPITHRVREDWVALIGSQNEGLLDKLIVSGDCLNTAGTRVWAAMEAVQKAIDEATPVKLQLYRSKNGTTALMSEQLGLANGVFTTVVSLHRKPDRMIAFVVPTNPVAGRPKPAKTTVKSTTSAATAAIAPAASMPSPASNGNGNGNGAASAMFAPAKPMDQSGPSPAMATPKAMAPAQPTGTQSMTPTQSVTPSQPMAPTQPMADNGSASAMPNGSEAKLHPNHAAPGEQKVMENVRAEVIWNGPRDQAVFEHRFVVTFKECAMRGKCVQHTQYLAWMGLMRENGLLYLVPDMYIKLSDGVFGMATNSTSVDVVGECVMGDVIVARLFMESMTDATVNLCCDYAKQLPNGRLERLATVRQAATWVELDGRNDPTKKPFPKFLFDAFKSMEPRVDREGKLPELPFSLGRVKLEENKLAEIPAHEPVKLWSENFSTCLDDSNIVANIYYARYFHWQWRTSDLYLYSVSPQLMTSITSLGNIRELLTVNSRIDFVRDAFPFDRIRTELAVTRSTECSATFQFTHYRVNDNGQEEKLCVGTQDVVWIRRTPNGTPVPEPFPLAVREAMKRGQMVSS